MTRQSDVCFVIVNGVIVDDGSERLLASGLEEKGSTVNLNGTGLREHIKEIPVHLLLLRNLRRGSGSSTSDKYCHVRSDLKLVKLH